MLAKEISLVLIIKIILITLMSTFLFHRIDKSTIPQAFSEVLWPSSATTNQEKSV